jgi:hypothetical protein
MSLKTTVLLALAFASSSMVVDAQLDLPGVDEKPGDPNALDSVLDCGQATNSLLMIPAVYTSLVQLRQSAVIKLQTQDSCETRGGDAVCTLDYGSSDIQNNYQTVCEGNGGVYDENDHQVTCQAPDDPTITGNVIYRFTNYPTCFSNTCEEDDLERWIADEVDDFEIDVERDTAWVCDSDYTIEETEPPQISTTGTCPNRINDTPDKCGPLAANLQSQQCDCYTFCDGQLMECEKFDSDGASDVFCVGELVMGCSNVIFATYDVQQKALAAGAAGSSATIVVAALASGVMALLL